VGYGLGGLVGRDQCDLREIWTRQNIIDEVFILIKAYKSFRNSSCVINYTRVSLCNYNTIE
jgi:hypothetical protein